MIKTNLHTHTVYCDGKSTAREMVERAVTDGFSALGFSGHSFTSFDTRYCMSREGTKEYRAEVSALREEYKGKIEIFCGIEQDIYGDDTPDGYDFVIGSVHYLKKNGEILPIDEDAPTLSEGVNRLYGGDWMKFAEDYYALAAKLADDARIDIIGHFDTLVKFNEGGAMFDESNPRYIAAWNGALEKIAASGKTIEINSGAVTRGYRTAPYPSAQIIRGVREFGMPVILNCDCHFAPTMDSGWQIAYEFAKTAGYTDAELEHYAKITLDKLRAKR